MRLFNMGCNCRRSGCLKSYCHCYDSKKRCTSNCKCEGCHNFDLDPPAEAKKKSMLLPPGSMRNSEQMNVGVENEKVLGSELCDDGSNASIDGSMKKWLEPSGVSPNKQQFILVTLEAIDATIKCMITQADECVKNGMPEYHTKKMVLEEWIRCIDKIIHFSIRDT